jgi:hypothetical protein
MNFGLLLIPTILAWCVSIWFFRETLKDELLLIVSPFVWGPTIVLTFFCFLYFFK